MRNKPANILFIPTSIGGYCAEPQDAPSQHDYYQRLILASLGQSVYTIEGLQALAHQLAVAARHAYLAKQMNAVERAAQCILALPISSQFESIARYYQALCKWQQGDTDSGRKLLDRLVEGAPPQYRPRALQAIGTIYQENGEVDAALRSYLAAGKAAANCDPFTLALSHRMIAVVRSTCGDHKRALADLENLFPLVRAVGKYYPASYYDYLNSLAVELGEVGRISEAEQACAVALASPFAGAHPNWAETRDEIAAKRISATPSIVAVNRTWEAAPTPLAEPRRKPRPVGALALAWPRCQKTSVQRASRIAVCTTIPHDETTQTILERVLTCIGSRAPPLAASLNCQPTKL